MMKEKSTSRKNSKPINPLFNRIASKDEPLHGWSTDDSSSTFSLEDEIGIEMWMKDKQLFWMATGIKRCQLLFDDQDSCDVLGRKGLGMRPSSEGEIRNFEHLERTSLKLKEGVVDKTNSWYGLVHDRPAVGLHRHAQNAKQKQNLPSDISKRRSTAGTTGPVESPIITMLRFQEKLKLKREAKVDRLRERLLRMPDIRAEGKAGKERFLPSRVSFTYGKLDDALRRRKHNTMVTDRETDSVGTGTGSNGCDSSSIFVNPNSKRTRNMNNVRTDDTRTSQRMGRSGCDPSSVVVNPNPKRTRNMNNVRADDTRTSQIVGYHQIRSISPIYYSTNQLLRECSMRTRMNLGSAKGHQLKYQSPGLHESQTNYLDYLKQHFDTSKYNTDIQNEFTNHSSDYIEASAHAQEEKAGLECSELKQSKEACSAHAPPVVITFPQPLDCLTWERGKQRTRGVKPAVRTLARMSKIASCQSHESEVSEATQSIPSNDTSDSAHAQGWLPALSSGFLINHYFRERSACKSKEIHLPSFKTSQFKCPLKRLREMTDKRVQFLSGTTECGGLKRKEKNGDSLVAKKNQSSGKGITHQGQTSAEEMAVVNSIGNKGTCCMRMPGRWTSEADSGLGE